MASDLSVKFRFFGYPLTMRLAWLSALAFAVVYVIVQLAPERSGASETFTWYARAAVLTIGSGLSILVHELAHFVVAKRLGFPLGAVRLYPLGAINQSYSRPASPSEEARIAIAGPVMSVAIGGLLVLFALVVPGESRGIKDVIHYLGLANLLLAGVNFLPGLPLDGGRLLRALVWYLHDNYAAGTRVAPPRTARRNERN